MSPVGAPHSPERKEDVTFASNFMVFGHGPHYCVGKEYAINHLTVFLANVASLLDWERVRWAALWTRPAGWGTWRVQRSGMGWRCQPHTAAQHSACRRRLLVGCRSAKSDHILYLPTIYPADSVFKLSWRVGGQAAAAAGAK
jgi:hypothetical protein